MSIKKVIKDLVLGINISKAKSSGTNQDNIIPEVINDKVEIKHEVSQKFFTGKNNLLEQYQDYGELLYESDLRTLIKEHQNGFREAYPELFNKTLENKEEEFDDDVSKLQGWGMKIPKSKTTVIIDKKLQFEQWWNKLIMVLVNEQQTHELISSNCIKQKKYESVYVDDDPTYEPIEENEEERIDRFYNQP